MILIKSMEMPETCTECEFLDYDSFDAEMHIGCLITGEIVTWDLDKCRNEKCPLSEVKVWGEQRNIMVETHTGLLLEKVKEIIDGID